MPSWKKVLVSGSAANLLSLEVDTFVSASSVSIGSTVYDSVHSSGSLNSVLVSSANGVLWAPTGSGGGGGITGGVTNYHAVFSSATTVTTGSIFQSGSSVLIGGNVTGSNNVRTQFANGVSISGSLTDSLNTTGSASFVLANTATGVQWQGPGPILLATGTVTTGSVSQSINLSAWNTLYNVIEVQLVSWLPIANNCDLGCRVSTNGTAYDGGAANYGYIQTFANDTGGTTGGSSTGDTFIMLNGTGTHVGNAATKPMNCILKLFNPGVATFLPMVQFTTNYYNAGGSNQSIAVGTGARLTAQATKGIQFLFNTGSIHGGLFRVYGYL